MAINPSYHLFQGRDYDRRDDRRDDRGKGKGGKGILAVSLVDPRWCSGYTLATRWQCGLGNWERGDDAPADMLKYAEIDY